MNINEKVHFIKNNLSNHMIVNQPMTFKQEDILVFAFHYQCLTSSRGFGTANLTFSLSSLRSLYSFLRGLEYDSSDI